MHQDGSDGREKVEARGLAGAKRGVANRGEARRGDTKRRDAIQGYEARRYEAIRGEYEARRGKAMPSSPMARIRGLPE